VTITATPMAKMAKRGDDYYPPNSISSACSCLVSSASATVSTKTVTKVALTTHTVTVSFVS
jgi:hypothetical protein